MGNHDRLHKNDPGHGAARCVAAGSVPLIHPNELGAVAANQEAGRCWAVGLDRSWPVSPWRVGEASADTRVAPDAKEQYTAASASASTATQDPMGIDSPGTLEVVEMELF